MYVKARSQIKQKKINNKNKKTKTELVIKITKIKLI